MAKGRVYISGQLVGLAEHAIVLEAMRHMAGEFHVTRLIDSTFDFYADIQAIRSPGGEFMVRHLIALHESNED